MRQTATYDQARSLKHALALFGVAIKPETFEMTTSGIYIPRWLGYSRIPHEYNASTGVAQWFFFFRFVSPSLSDINVGEALDFSFPTPPGANKKAEFYDQAFQALVKRIRSNTRSIVAA